MFGEYCSTQANISMSTAGLTAVSFQQALDEYRYLIGGGRIRAIRFLYVDSCETLEEKITSFFKTSFEETTAGRLAKFTYLGIPMTVSLHGRGIFRLCEEY